PRVGSHAGGGAAGLRGGVSRGRDDAAGGGTAPGERAALRRRGGLRDRPVAHRHVSLRRERVRQRSSGLLLPEHPLDESLSGDAGRKREDAEAAVAEITPEDLLPERPALKRGARSGRRRGPLARPAASAPR